jgi:Flp pilus assembly protein TadG
MTTSPSSPDRGSESGQAIIEFALVAPLAFFFVFGIITACLIFFQNSSLHDGASAGARIASFESSLALQQTTGVYAGQFCESNQPVSIEAAVARATPGLTVNMGRLCSASGGATQLTQATSPASQVNITVTCAGGCAAPTSTTVSLVVVSHGVAYPMPFAYTMRATSTNSLLSP